MAIAKVQEAFKKASDEICGFMDGMCIGEEDIEAGGQVESAMSALQWVLMEEDILEKLDEKNMLSLKTSLTEGGFLKEE